MQQKEHIWESVNVISLGFLFCLNTVNSSDLLDYVYPDIS